MQREGKEVDKQWRFQAKKSKLTVWDSALTKDLISLLTEEIANEVLTGRWISRCDAQPIIIAICCTIQIPVSCLP